MSEQELIRKSKVARMFSLHEFLPAHMQLCIFNIMLVLFIFSLMVGIDILLDDHVLFHTEVKGSSFYVWFPPTALLAAAILLFTFCAIIYFIQAKFWPNNRCCFTFGTVMIFLALIFFFSTVLLCPYFFVCFFLSFTLFDGWIQKIPTLFSYMCVLVILSLFNIGFVVWVVGWIACQALCESIGIKKKLKDLMYPIKLVNDDNRIEVSMHGSEAETVIEENEEISITNEYQVELNGKDVEIGPAFM